MFNADMNFDNFRDGRARHHFNDGSLFGRLRPAAPTSWWRPARTIWGNTTDHRFVSLASLATGPALSGFEIASIGRNWAKLGKKLHQGDWRQDLWISKRISVLLECLRFLVDHA
jgi:hypothetical protein